MAEIDLVKLLGDVERLKAEGAPIVADVKAILADVGLADRINVILDWIEKNGGERIATAIHL